MWLITLYPEQPLVLRGIVSSEDFNNVTLKAGEDPSGAPLLPNRDYGTIYTGIVTFTTTKPVEVGISHRLHIDNNTFSSLIQIDLENYILDSIM